MKRGSAIRNTLGLLAAGSTLGLTTAHTPNKVKKGNINQSVCRWCFNQFSLEQMCKAVKEIGIHAIDLCGPKDWSTLQQHGIYSSMCNGAEISLTEGFNNPRYHAELQRRYTDMIPLVAKNGYKNLICFSGNRAGMADKVGLQHMRKGVEKILPVAEKHNVVLCLELFNTKVDHPDYMADTIEWGAALCKQLSSSSFGLLYDIYHMQIQQGNIIATIRDYSSYIVHYHTAGVPGRHEIDQSQELYYPAVVQAIIETQFKGYIAHEFIPTNKSPWSSLKQAFNITKYRSL